MNSRGGPVCPPAYPQINRVGADSISARKASPVQGEVSGEAARRGCTALVNSEEGIVNSDTSSSSATVENKKEDKDE